MAFRGQGRGGRGTMPGLRTANVGPRGPPLMPGPHYPGMMPGVRPGMLRPFSPRLPRGMPPPGLPRGMPPRGLPPGIPPGVPPPGIPPHPMHVQPNFPQAILPNVPQVVQANANLGVNMVAQPQVILPGNMQMIRVPPPDVQMPVQPPVPQPGQVHKDVRTMTSTANHPDASSRGHDGNSQIKRNQRHYPESRRDRKEALDLDEGEIVDDEEYEDRVHHRQDMRNDRPPHTERLDRRERDFEPRREGDTRYDRGHPRRDERKYDEGYDDERRDTNWSERDREQHDDRDYREDDRYRRQEDEEYYEYHDDRRRDYDRRENYDRGRDSYRDDRGYVDDRARYNRDDRENYSKDRRGARWSPDRQEFGMAAEQASRRSTVDDREYRDNRSESRPYDRGQDRRDERRDFGRDHRDERDNHRGREPVDSRHERDRDNFGMAAQLSENTRTRESGRHLDRGSERRIGYEDEYDRRTQEEWERDDYDRYDQDRRKDGLRFDTDRRTEHPDRGDRSRNEYNDRSQQHRENYEQNRRRNDLHYDSGRRRDAIDQHQDRRDQSQERRDERDHRRRERSPHQKSRKEYFDSGEGVWKDDDHKADADDRASHRESATKEENARTEEPETMKEEMSKETRDKTDEIKDHRSGLDGNVDAVTSLNVSDTPVQNTMDMETQLLPDSSRSRSKSPQTIGASSSQVKPVKSSASRSRRSPSLTKQSGSSHKQNCEHDPPEKEVCNVKNEKQSSNRHDTSSSSNSSTRRGHRMSSRSPSSSRRTGSRERSQSRSSLSQRSSRSRNSVSPRVPSRKPSGARHEVRTDNYRYSPGREPSSRDRQYQRGFSSEKSRSPKKAVAIVPPRKRSPIEEQNSRAKRSKVDRPLPTDQPLRDRDEDGRLMDEIPLAETSRSENVSTSRTEKFSHDHADDEDDDIEAEFSTPVPAWTRSSPADLYFSRERKTGNMIASKRMLELEDKFEEELLKRSAKVRASKPKYEKTVRSAPVHHHHHHHHGGCNDHSESDNSSSSSDEDSEEENDRMSQWMEELMAKKQHPDRLHEELWFNEDGEMNDGPLCRCSLKSRKTGIRHDIYPGEGEVPLCDPNSNNAGRLYHYRISMSPSVNFLSKRPTIIKSDNHEFIFEGFSILSHYQIDNVPVCKVIRFNIEYTIHWFEEDAPENFDVRSLDLFNDFIFYEILELRDFKSKLPAPDTCRHFHIMPRFSRRLKENGKEMLSMNEVLLYLLKSAKPVVDEADLPRLAEMDIPQWEDWVDSIRAMIIAKPGLRPSSIRIDQLDRERLKRDSSRKTSPIIVHFGIRPAQLSYAGDPNYQKLWKQYVKLKHLLANKPKVNESDKRKLMALEDQLQDMRMRSSMKREVTVELSAQNFVKTGIKSDICQHAMLLPVLIGHLRFHKCLNALEDRIRYRFKDRMLIQLALTHPSYRVNFGTNPDHARNSLSNCGFRQPEYGDRRIHHVHNRKRGINTLINIMSRMGKKQETASEINHYERLEFLGDAVVEFLSSIHLFYMFPNLEEGGLATYRAAIVQNQHLSLLAKKLKLQEYMLYAHGPDLCHESDLKHAMANCLEALMGALFLDGGIDLADRVFGEVLFDDDEGHMATWTNLSRHPLQEDEPNGDRHWIQSSPVLQKLVKFEEDTGIPFNHVRLLARAFTMRNVGFNNLTFGHNQRLEFLGDTVLQIVASEYLFKHFPEHHEGHLSLLRSSLVNNFTQAVVCDDLGMTDYIIHSDARLVDKDTMKHKEKADLLEAYIGALYVDRDLEYCQVFSNVCFFPRLKQFIMNQDWNDPKSQLQQCCLTLRELEGGEPDIPIYKMIESTGPTNTRKYTVAVYFRAKRLATGTGHSIQMAEMAAATNALQDKSTQEWLPQLNYQVNFHQQKFFNRDHQKPAPIYNFYEYMDYMYNDQLGMFPQLDYQKKFVEKKYRMAKENKQRRRDERKRAVDDKGPDQTDKSETSQEKRSKSPKRESSRDSQFQVTSDKKFPSEVSEDGQRSRRSNSPRSPKPWRRGSLSSRGGFPHPSIRARGRPLHRRPFGRTGVHWGGFGARSMHRGGSWNRGHAPRPTRSHRS